MDCMLFTFETTAPLIGKIAASVLLKLFNHGQPLILLPLLNSFNKTEAAIFSNACRASVRLSLFLRLINDQGSR